MRKERVFNYYTITMKDIASKTQQYLESMPFISSGED